MLERKPGSNWSNKDCFSVKKNDICTITDPFLDDVHLLGNEHNRVRAMELIKSGVVQKESIKHINLSSRIKDLISIIMFKFQVTPPMKSEVIDVAGNDSGKMHKHHTSHLAFDG